MIRRAFFVVIAALALSSLAIQAGSTPARARLGMVITQSDIASQIGFEVIKGGGNAIDAAVATALALAVTHPPRATSAAAVSSSFARPAASRFRMTSAKSGRRGRRPRCG